MSLLGRASCGRAQEARWACGTPTPCVTASAISPLPMLGGGLGVGGRVWLKKILYLLYPLSLLCLSFCFLPSPPPLYLSFQMQMTSSQVIFKAEAWCLLQWTVFEYKIGKRISLLQTKIPNNRLKQQSWPRHENGSVSGSIQDKNLDVWFNQNKHPWGIAPADRMKAMESVYNKEQFKLSSRTIRTIPAQESVHR